MKTMDYTTIQYIKKDIQKDRLNFKGYGSKQPVDSNVTKKGRQNNRRTEFKIL